MSLFSRLFAAKEPASGRGVHDLEAQLDRLEAEVKRAPGGYKGTPLNKAGDLALRAGDRTRGLQYYGRAIDAFLLDQQREAARGVANKIIRVHPKAVRTLCTLTWLDLAARHMATALLHLRDYTEAAKAAKQQALAGDQIRAMARIAPQPEFLEAAADALDGLDFADRAKEVREWAGGGGSPDVLTDEHELADACLDAAVRSNEPKPSG